MKYISAFILSVMVLTVTSCINKKENSEKPMKASKVELGKIDGRYSLIVNGEAFYVKGAGCDDGDIAALGNHGANAFRTWMDSEVHIPAEEVLRLAEENGLMVMMGLNIARERHGFDYNDEEAVKKQFEEVKQKVLEMKDHPALLGWGIGNELNLRSTNFKVWDAIEEIAAFIHEVDGNHPTTTMLAGIGREEVEYISENCPHIDFLSIQMYGDIVNLAARIEEAGYTGPYLVTEWGATGHWEVPATDWGAPIENTSTEKARDIKERYENVILADSIHCLGSFVFLWGQKQERTPTWYGLFTEEGNETEAIDVMHYFWNNKWPENRSPKILEARLDKKSSHENIRLLAGKSYLLDYRFEDPDGDSLNLRFEILSESTDLKDGGDLESKPESFEIKPQNISNTSANFQSPKMPGNYRIFIYASDGNNHTATVNIPFLIE